MLHLIKTNPCGSVLAAILILCCAAILAIACWSGYVRVRDDGVVSFVEDVLTAIGAITVVGWAMESVPAMVRWLDQLVRW